MNALLYLLITIIWSTSYYAVKLQMGNVPPIWSVIYRFGLAAIILLIFCFVTKRSLRFNLRSHLLIAVQGVLLFSCNYVLFYLGTPYLITGLIAVIFAMLVVLNIFHSRIFFKTPIVLNIVLGAGVGISGLVVVFWSEIKALHINANNLHYLLLGSLFCFLAALSASWGQMLSLYTQKQRALPVIESNALGMAYGTLFTTVLAFLSGEVPSFNLHFEYIASLIYLAVVATVIAFGAYMTLIRRMGPTQASYSFVVIPIFAMCVSTIFEGFKWTPNIIWGALLIMVGNLLVLYKRAK